MSHARQSFQERGNRWIGEKYFFTLAAHAAEPRPNVLAKLSFGISGRCIVRSTDNCVTQWP